MSNYLAIVTFIEDGARSLGIFNNTSDSIWPELLPDSSDAREFIQGGDRDQRERFETLYLRHHSEPAHVRRESLAQRGDLDRVSEMAIVEVPGYDLVFATDVNRAHRFITGPTMPDDDEWLDATLINGIDRSTCPITRRLVGLIARKLSASGYSWCHRCGRPWNICESHPTKYALGRGCFPLCEDCWQELSPQARLPYYRLLWDQWKSAGQDRAAVPPLHVWQTMKYAVLRGG